MWELAMGFNNSANNLFRQQGIVNSATNYVVLATDSIVNITSTAAARDVTLPAPSVTQIGKTFIVKDTSGGAATNNITITGASGNIDGAATIAIESDYGSIVLWSDGTNYFTQSSFNTSRVKEYIYATKSTTQLISSFPTNVSFQTTVGNIPFATPLFTLLQGKTYNMSAVLGHSTSSDSTRVVYGWVLSGGSDLGDSSVGTALSADFNSVTQGIQGPAAYIYTPPTNKLVKVVAQGGSGTPTLGGDKCFVKIIEL